MQIKNEAMLITYSDSLGKNMKDLKFVLETYFKESIGGVHLLPFFPSTGDRGFAPSDYTTVISRESKFFQDFKKNHENSPYKDMFIRVHEFFPPGRPTQEDIDLIYKRKDKAPFQTVQFEDGSTEEVWNTFGEEQIDLDVKKEIVKAFIRETIKDMASHGCSLIRLDAFAYAVKKLDTNDFFVEPEIWDLLNEVRAEAAKYQVELLPEIHEHYSIQMKIADHDYFVYDFALPMVVLYSLYSGKSNRLANWLKMSPMKQFTTLDTHDGIGVVDARDLLTDEELDYTSEQLYKVGANVKRVYSSEKYNNLDIYQINSTYYSALGNDDASYLLSRILQCFAPGIPQIYYVGLLAGENDIELLEATKEGRNINRHYYTLEEIEKEVERPVVKQLLSLLHFRNTSKAFDLEGEIEILTPDESTIEIVRTSADQQTKARLIANLATKEYTIEENGVTVQL